MTGRGGLIPAAGYGKVPLRHSRSGGIFAMRFLRPVAAAFVTVCLFALPAAANILIQIDKSTQQMTV